MGLLLIAAPHWQKMLHDSLEASPLPFSLYIPVPWAWAGAETCPPCAAPAAPGLSFCSSSS